MNKIQSIFVAVITHVALLSSTCFADSSHSLYINGPSGGDDTNQIQSAINLAIQNGNTSIYLANGTYQIKSLSTVIDTSDQGHLTFQGGKSISLIGESEGGVIFKFLNTNRSGIIVRKTRNFTMQNITLDYYYAPYGQGTVVSIDTVNRNIWVRGDVGYAYWDNPYFNLKNSSGTINKAVFLMRTNRGQTPPQCNFLPDTSSGWSQNWGNINGLNWFHYQDMSNCPDKIAIGQKVVLNPAHWTSNAIHLDHVEGFILKNDRIYSSPGISVFVDYARAGDSPNFSSNLIDGLKVMYSPESDRSTREISSNADGVHFSGSRAPVTIQNSTFYGQADDGINAHVWANYAYSLFMSGSTPILRYYPSSEFEIGDKIEIFNPSRKQVRCDATVVSAPYSISSDSVAKYVNLSSDAASCTLAEGFYGTNSTTADWVANLSEAGLSGALTIKNNNFFANRGRAIVNHFFNTNIIDNVIGSLIYGHSNWWGIQEGYTTSELIYGEGAFVYPGRDNQLIYGNSGYYGNKVFTVN